MTQERGRGWTEEPWQWWLIKVKIFVKSFANTYSYPQPIQTSTRRDCFSLTWSVLQFLAALLECVCFGFEDDLLGETPSGRIGSVEVFDKRELVRTERTEVRVVFCEGRRVELVFEGTAAVLLAHAPHSVVARKCLQINSSARFVESTKVRAIDVYLPLEPWRPAAIRRVGVHVVAIATLATSLLLVGIVTTSNEREVGRVCGLCYRRRQWGYQSQLDQLAERDSQVRFNFDENVGTERYCSSLCCCACG